MTHRSKARLLTALALTAAAANILLTAAHLISPPFAATLTILQSAFHFDACYHLLTTDNQKRNTP